MATSYKTIEPKDIISTRNLLHEAIPITGALISSSAQPGSWPRIQNENIRNYSHGLFQSVYDYPYLSSSANHILDITCGYAATSSLSSATNTENAKKINIYNEMAQTLVGFDRGNKVGVFDNRGSLTIARTEAPSFDDGLRTTKIDQAIFINFSRLMTKDEISKGSFTMELGVSASYTYPFRGLRIKLRDRSGSAGSLINSPAGEYGVLFAEDNLNVLHESIAGAAALNPNKIASGDTVVRAGLIYYQAGIAVVTSSVFGSLLAKSMAASGSDDDGSLNGMNTAGDSVEAMLTGSTISSSCNSIRHRINNIQFNNTTELNSTVTLCKVSNNDFNYSSNPTYLSASRMVVKTFSTDLPVSFVTTVGLYSADSVLLAVAKLREPLRKDPAKDYIFRVRLDY